MARLCNAGSDAASQGTNSPKGKKILSMLQLGIHNVPSISRSDTATDEELNPHLNERFGRRAAFQDPKPPIQPTYSMTLALDIRKYAKKLEAVTNASSPAAWHGISEFPKWSEVFDPGRRAHNEDVELDSNTIVGPFSSKEDYLARHYNLLREDAVAPLRDVVSECQIYPHMSERTSRNDAYVYDKTFINGFTFTTSGLAARLTFSLGRVGKKIRWEQSKRLRTGTLVALTPANAPFKSIVRVAVVAARPISGLEENPPTIDVFFTMPEEIEIDPQQEWVMVESRNGFFEGHRHMLRGLQMLANEAFPLSNHIVNIERNILPPRYRTLRPTMDCSSIFTTLTTDEKKNVDVTQDLPSWPSLLDSTQLQALQRILGKRLSIVQGPPGTGKTFVSVVAIRLMLENRKPNDPPIIVSSHTNHALDQLLRHIAEFEPEFVRIGGMSTDLEVVRPRTLYEIKQAVNFQDPKGCLRAPALKELRQLTKEMKSLLSSLMAGDKLPSAESFEQHGVISAKQRESLVKGAQQWFDCDSNAQDVLDYWLGDQKIETKLRIAPEDFGLELEEVDLEIEQIREIEAEQRTLDDEDPEILRGEWVQLNEKWTGLKVPGVSMTNMTSEMKRQDMYDIPEALRGPLYRHMQMKLKGTIRDRLRNKAKRYASLVQEAKVGRMEVDYNFIKDAKILGLTTSGLAKYRPLLQSLKPKVVLIEEAAETLESYISISCFESLEHLILVGDHEQLRGHCHVQDLELEPFYLGISMFERLVRNSLDYTQLQSQRRMIPEIRRALTPVYPDLRDHDSVYNRPPVPGMAADTFFFSHSAPESADEQMSKMNLTEAELVVSFFVYLVQNGIAPLKITVLTFYNGQRKLLLRKLKAHPELTGQYFKVVTVDSYQGEEAEIGRRTPGISSFGKV
ncbi:uncharacterized protein KY384_000631 [Bacidia gigantensis]|uniref:uncharacterized protein n=1 Tax=Bacidia gigantensis TaxID=2732470 RepID=UPI001D0573B4|nr:uncharacterized protein KY384_000631 [Bacidia gigantensis]KAG8525871.1 hypothetical protein KY384_000631 [Bacidia gigantensis]